jgi:hypothetical protein
METLLKILFTKAMYENSDITEIRSLTDLYQAGFVRELFEILESAWKENIPLDVVISAANAAYQGVRKNA